MKFGFSIDIEAPGYWKNDKYVEGKPTGKVNVTLPHNCDNWEIAGGNGTYLTKKEAVKKLETFIKEAQLTLEKLKKV